MIQIQTLEDVMNVWAESSAPAVRPHLYRGRNRKWHVCLLEDNADNNYVGNQYNSSSYDKKINWMFQILENCKTAHRTAWNMWYFDSKRDAEKFITMYYLVWAE